MALRIYGRGLRRKCVLGLGAWRREQKRRLWEVLCQLLGPGPRALTRLFAAGKWDVNHSPPTLTAGTKAAPPEDRP
jgi:hypothetical protein